MDDYVAVAASSGFLITEGLKSLFRNDDRFSLFSCVHSHHEFLAGLNNRPPVLLITDLSIHGLSRAAGLQQIKTNYPELRILLILNSVSQPEIDELKSAGIKNIILNNAGRSEILNAVDHAIAGKKYYSREILEMIVETNESKPERLTVSEAEIVQLIAGGLTTREIASRRNVSFHTVNTHRKNIFRKLKVTNTSELIMHAIRAGWIDNIEYYI
jgi:DNA-binding NarL/FixJ family response regulator